jgi:hypothetical protein
VTVAPAIALGAWVGFSGTPASATLMGDRVLVSGELKRAGGVCEAGYLGHGAPQSLDR